MNILIDAFLVVIIFTLMSVVTSIWFNSYIVGSCVVTIANIISFIINPNEAHSAVGLDFSTWSILLFSVCTLFNYLIMYEVRLLERGAQK